VAIAIGIAWLVFICLGVPIAFVLGASAMVGVLLSPDGLDLLPALIPPTMDLIIIGIVGNMSIAGLFAAGILPAFVNGLGLMAWSSSPAAAATAT
jgi:TRAP-type C4-dicarboxylate transport system permease large subunit